jgi:septal ring-binding cell division protein DamX
MSKKNDRAWFVCPQWSTLVSGHYASDAEAGRALKTNPRVLARLRSRTPVAKSTLLRALQAFAGRHDVGAPIADLVIDTRAR